MWHAKYIGKKLLASDIWEFRFARPEGFAYIPGQYAGFAFHEPLEDSRGQSRVMSLTSHPNDNYIAFVTRVSEQPSLFKQHLANLHAGDAMLVDAALGDLVFPRSTATPLVFVAGGIGIASYISMLKDLQRSNENRTVHLLYALRGHDEKLFSDTLAQFPFASSSVFVSPRRLDADTIIATSADASDTLYYLSGTERFVEELRADLLARGLSDTQIAFDYFTGY